MNGLPYYKAYPRDFIEGTIGMGFELKCAYRVVLDLIYMQGGELPDDARYISGLLGCSVRKWNAIRQQLTIMGKLTVSGEFLTNDRAVIELESLRKVQDKQRENRSRPNKNNNLESPRSDHTEPEPEEKEDPNGSSKNPPQKKSSFRGARLPDDWTLTKSLGDWAMGEGLSEARVRQEADKFRDYWHSKAGKDATKIDWSATWRNWVRRALQDDNRRPPSGGRPLDPDDFMARRDAEAERQRRLEALRAENTETGPVESRRRA